MEGDGSVHQHLLLLPAVRHAAPGAQRPAAVLRRLQRLVARWRQLHPRLLASLRTAGARAQTTQEEEETPAPPPRPRPSQVISL